MSEDPYAILGVDRSATEEELRVARRRLARQVHPDRAGGTAAANVAMQRLNAAFDAALAQLGATPVAAAEPVAPPAGHTPASPAPVPRPGGRLAHDVASFTIEALPAEAFEAVLIVATWLGDVLDDNPPYQLDVLLGDPLACWCRLDLVPDAGASTVALTLASVDARPLPDIDAVRDAWVAELNQL